jgi:hypothetical protein
MGKRTCAYQVLVGRFVGKRKFGRCIQGFVWEICGKLVMWKMHTGVWWGDLRESGILEDAYRVLVGKLLMWKLNTGFW